jgi:Ni/Co efflux regulator RcnB
MKRLLHAALALSLISPAVALAQPYNQGGPPGTEHGPGNRGEGGPPGAEHGPGNRGEGERGPAPANPGQHEAMSQKREWHRGDHFEGHRYVLDWHRHHLRQPPRGYEWVHDGNQYVMIAIASGVIADVLVHAH